jgi:hypothetical protein
MNALYGRTPRGTPRPPKHIEMEMIEAGKNHDQLRLNVAKAAYKAWLRDHGYTDGAHGSEAPDNAWGE